MLLVLALPVLAQNYDFVADSVNCIELNGDDWSTLRKALKNAKSWNDGKFQVVQIGDSHIQPDIMTAQVRNSMQDKWGNGGRGLIPAFNLAKTNEPRFTCDLQKIIPTRIDRAAGDCSSTFRKLFDVGFLLRRCRH